MDFDWTALTFILEWNFQMWHAFLLKKKKWKSECKEEMIHKFQTIRLSFLEFQSLANVNIFLQSINTALNTTLNDTM